MCGIAGIFRRSANRDNPIERPLVLAMADAMTHRGPDEGSCFIEGEIGLGFRRLSIVDISNGGQPFFSVDNNIVLICNGEIYNYRELRAEMETRGHRCKTRCDVEVMVYLYQEYGMAFLNKLNGQFALAIYDKKEASLFLARDQFGICPVFYTQVEEEFIFASEIKALLKHPNVKRCINLEGLDQILSFPGLVSPVTLFKGISALAAGHYLVVRQGKVGVHEYWDLDYPESSGAATRSESYYREGLEELLLQAVRYRLQADVPIGFYLSGGLDSSLIGGLIKAVRPEVGYPSFSIAFPHDREMDEREYRQYVIDHLALDHTEIGFRSEDIEGRLKQAVWTAESALKESYNTCSLALSESVNKKGIKVVLSGEGADELFGGYPGYRFDKQRANSGGMMDLDGFLEEETRERLWGDPTFFYEKDYYQFSETRRSLYSAGVREQLPSFEATERLVFNKSRIRNRHILHKRSYIDLKLRLSDHLIADHCDRTAYAHSVEGRYPFLDINLVEFARTVPPDLKLKGLEEKYILKRIAEKYVPKAVVDRQKFGFVAPGSPNLLRMNKEWINDLLSYEQIKRQGYFDADCISALKKAYTGKDFLLNLPYDSDLLIVVLTFNILLELFDMPAFG